MPYQPSRPLEIEAFELPETGPSHVRVRPVASGGCRFDRPLIKDEWPREVRISAHPPRTS